MRFVTLLAGMVCMTGCATGAPMGSLVDLEDMGYSPATPAAMARAIPDPIEEAPRPAPVVARAPSAPAPAPVPVVAKRPQPAAPKPKKRVEPAPRPVVPVVKKDAREAVLATARSLVGKPQVKVAGRAYPADCTGLVEAAYAQAGISLRGASKSGDNGVTALYRYAQTHGRVYSRGKPVPGDLVFFRETYDRNRDGRTNDGLTHVGIVDQVTADGTVTVIHRVNRGVVSYRMNLDQPRVARDPRTQQVINDTLRGPGPGKAFALTGQLFVAYGSVLPVAPAAPVAVAQR
ncbi:MAG TPA: CHAP domain-containing protein [Myxococcaceae bacterium]|nr:CHAP domain-containing protein [Myxococcaceae bacterium]